MRDVCPGFGVGLGRGLLIPDGPPDAHLLVFMKQCMRQIRCEM